MSYIFGMPDAWILDALRTPIGRARGALSAVRPDDLAAGAIARLVERTAVAPDEIDDVYPLGCSGARIVATLAWELHRRGGRYGLATMCVGVGQGVALVIENPDGSR